MQFDFSEYFVRMDVISRNYILHSKLYADNYAVPEIKTVMYFLAYSSKIPWKKIVASLNSGT